MNTLGKIFGNSTHLKLLNIFYNDRKSFYNLSELARMISKSAVTTRKGISDLVDADILGIEKMSEVCVVYLKMDGKYTEGLISMIDKIQTLDEGDVVKELIARRQ
ncbi:MAG: hypothetical protein H8D26_08260 [Methanomicrobia archaeon]|nr:hypothetical protein [Methanomicrobia archaeon]